MSYYSLNGIVAENKARVKRAIELAEPITPSVGYDKAIIILMKQAQEIIDIHNRKSQFKITRHYYYVHDNVAIMRLDYLYTESPGPCCHHCKN